MALARTTPVEQHALGPADQRKSPQAPPDTESRSLAHKAVDQVDRRLLFLEIQAKPAVV